MEIGIFTKSLSKGGAEKQSVLLSSLLCKYYNVHLIVFFGNKVINYYDLLTDRPVNIVFIQGNIFTKCVRLIRYLKRENISLLFCYLFSTNVIGSLAGKIAGVKYIIGGIRNCSHPYLKEIGLRIAHNRLTDYTISNSYTAFDILTRKKFNPYKMSVIQNGIIKNVNAPFHDEKGNIVILTVARFVKQKDYYTAVKAVHYLYNNLLNNKLPQIKYKIVGYGKLKKKLNTYIKTFNLENIIELVDSENINSVFQNADIYLSTSLFEGVSNSILEAMNNRLPIVATDVGDNRYLIKHGKNGFLCNTKDYITIAKVLSILVEDNSMRIKMGNLSCKLIEENFSSDVFVKRYLKFICHLEKKTEIPAAAIY